MTPLVWNAGHIGWPLFGILVFSALCLIVTDIVWRLVRVAARTLLIGAGIIWILGVMGLVALLRL